MARETTKWPSTRWPITKIMSSDGCNGNRVPLEMGPWYDFREFGCHLGNVGSNIERVVCGHLHRPITARWHGTVLSVAPSTAHQMGLNMIEGARQQIVMEPPACNLHMWHQDTGIISHTSYTGDYEVPLSITLP